MAYTHLHISTEQQRSGCSHKYLEVKKRYSRSNWNEQGYFFHQPNEAPNGFEWKRKSKLFFKLQTGQTIASNTVGIRQG